MRILFRIVLAILTILGGTAAFAAPVSKNAPIRVFVAEWATEEGVSRIQFRSLAEKPLLRGITKAGFNIQAADRTPLVSQERLKSSEVRTQRKASDYVGHVRLQVSGDQAVKVLNDQNEKVILKTAVTDLQWTLDRKAAFAEARKAGARYALLVEVHVEPIDSQGPQKAFDVSVDATLHQVSDGKVVREYSGNLSRMGATRNAAVQEAASSLGQQLAEEIARE